MGQPNYWARELLMKLGHEARLISAQFVRSFVKANKTDFNIRSGAEGCAGRAHVSQNREASM